MDAAIASLNSLAAYWWSSTLRALWQGSLAIIVVWIINVVAPRIPSNWRCWMWRLTFVKVFIAFLLPMYIELPFFGHSNLLPEPISAAHDYLYQDSPSHNFVVQPAKAPLQTEFAQEHPRASASKCSWLFLAWGCVLSCSILRLVMGHRYLRRLVSLAQRDNYMLPLECRKMLDASGAEIRFSSQTKRPFLTGFRRPMIILPLTMSSTDSINDQNELKLIIAHELAHVQRKDLLWCQFSGLVKTLFFMNPLMWLAYSEIRVTQEMACDEAAVRVTDLTPGIYGRLLLHTLSYPNGIGMTTSSSIGAVDTYRSVKRRLIAMKEWSRNDRLGIASALTIVIILGLSVIPFRLVPKAYAEKNNVVNQEEEAEKSYITLHTNKGKSIDITEASKILGVKGIGEELQHAIEVIAYQNNANVMVINGSIDQMSRVVAGVPRDFAGKTLRNAELSLEAPKQQRFFHRTDWGSMSGLKGSDGKDYSIYILMGYLDSYTQPPVVGTPAPPVRYIKVKDASGKQFDFEIPGRFIHGGKVYDNPSYKIHTGYVSLYLKDSTGKTSVVNLRPTLNSSKSLTIPFKRLTGKKAPVFQAKDIEGRPFTLNIATGKPSILVFTQYTGPNPIPYTKEEEAKLEKYRTEQLRIGIGYSYKVTELTVLLNELKKTYSDKIDIAVVALGTPDDVKQYAAGVTHRFPVIIGNSKLASEFDALYNNTTVCIVKPDGIVRYHRQYYNCETEDIMRRLAKELVN